MKKYVIIQVTIVLFLISAVSTAIGGSRYYGAGYRSHHYSGHYYNRGYHHRSSDAWAYLGIGLLTGAVFSAIVTQPRRERTVVYTDSSPVYVETRPSVRYNREPQYRANQYRVPHYQAPQQELVLKRVKTTTELLNIRYGPGTDTSVVGQLQQGAVLDVLGAAPEWLYIKTSGGQYGWVMGKFTQDTVMPAG